RQSEKPVGDRAAERSLLGPLYVDVDELVVVGGVGKSVDPLLGQLLPLRVAEVRAGRLAQAGDGRFQAAVVRRGQFRQASARRGSVRQGAATVPTPCPLRRPTDVVPIRFMLT